MSRRKDWPPNSWNRFLTCLRKLPGRGLSILLVEQKLAIAMEISNRVLVMGHGQLVFEGTPDELRVQTIKSARNGWRYEGRYVELGE